MSALILRLIADDRFVLSPQSLNEFYNVARGPKVAMPVQAARDFLRTLMPYCKAPLDARTTGMAWEVQDRTGYRWYDCVLLASALSAGCHLFLSEDMQHGRVLGDMRILNPFLTTPDLEGTV
jgi:predicted nucleic acid-binding protein